MISISNDTLLVTSLAYLCFLALVLQLYKLFLRDFFIERKQSYAMKPLKLPRFENNGQSGVIYIFDDFLTKYRMIPMNLPRKRLKNKRTSSESPNFAARSLEENIPLTLFPYLPGCEPDGKAALQMQKLFPTVSRLDIVRFLVARKGNISLASEMLKKARDWKNANIPAKRSLVENVYKTGCFISKGYAKDGSPVVYFRWGLYDTNKASFEAYVLAAAHLIEFLVKDHSRFVNATIVIDLSVVKDGSNGPTDMNFIKLLVQVNKQFLESNIEISLSINSVYCK